MHDQNVGEKWTTFKLAWDNYTIAQGLKEKDESVQVATLLTVIGEEARAVFSTFQWDDADAHKIEPRKNVPFERYKFSRRQQQPGETYDQYKTALRKLAQTCAFDSITPNKILRDRLVFSIADAKVHERLLRETKDLTERTDEICRAVESTLEQLRTVSEQADGPLAVQSLSRRGTPTKGQDRPRSQPGKTARPAAQ